MSVVSLCLHYENNVIQYSACIKLLDSLKLKIPNNRNEGLQGRVT